MKRVGYDADFAGAVEAVASTGGQIMPPMMGAAAFILAQNVGIPYVKVAACAALPAILYYLAVFFMVDFRAGKIGLQGTPEDAMPDLRKTFREGWMLILPIILIVYLMAIGKSAQFSALFATLSLIMVSFAHKKTRVDGRGLVRALTNGIKDTAGVSVTAGAAGIIIGRHYQHRAESDFCKSDYETMRRNFAAGAGNDRCCFSDPWHGHDNYCCLHYCGYDHGPCH